jgi:hypothetical protein
MADISSSLPVTDRADGSTGSAVPSLSIQVAGSDGTDLRTIATDSTGKLNINNISGTVSLPTGAATSANQTSVIGSSSGGTAATSSELVGGVYNSTLPALTTGQQAALQLDSNGRILTVPAEATTSGSIASNGNILQLPAGAIPTLSPYSGIILEISGTWSATLTLTGSNGGSYYTIDVISLDGVNGSSPQSTITSNGLYYAPIGSVDIELSASSYVSGTVNCYATLRSNPPQLIPPTLVSSKTLDGSGNSISSYNSQLDTADIINTSISSGSISVGTSAVVARVGASNLANRKMLTISPTNGTIYLGATSGVTTTTGIPIFQNQVISFAFGSGVSPYLIAGSTITTIIVEGA